MKRKASCACGQLGITVEGDPEFVVACSCLKCQTRTGSVFGVSAYFKDAQVLGRSGESKPFSRKGDSGFNVQRQFCPHCGTTVFWHSEMLVGFTGVGVGSFADPNFPAPQLAAWNQSKHPWVQFPTQCRQSDTQRFDNN